MTERSLEQLFAVFLAHGDEDALAQLLRRSSPTLRRLAQRLGADAEDAEDLIQETLVAAIDSADRFDPSRPLLPWLKGILTFRAAKLARGRFRRRRLAEPLPPHEPADDAPTTSPAGQAIAGEFAGDVHAAIERMPQTYRAPLQAYLVHGHSPVEIAQQLGEARATVRVRLHRGLQRLRSTLARWAGLALALLLGRRATAARGPALAIAGGVAVLVASLIAVLRREEPPAAPAVAATAERTEPATAATTSPMPAGDERLPPMPTDAATAPASEVAVQLVDDSGRPVPHVGVTFLQDLGGDPVLGRGRVVTGDDGIARWSAAGPAGVTVTTDRGVACTLQPGGAPAPHRLVLRSGRTVNGRVVDPRGHGVGSASVWLAATPDGPWRGDDVITTAADGTFTLHHVAPDSWLAARHATLARSDVQQLAAGDEPIVLQLGQPGGRVVVQVRDPHGQPCPGALVFVGESMDAATLQLAQGAAPFRPPPCEGHTAGDGTFTSSALAAGRHPIFVRAVGAVPCSAFVDVAAADTAVVPVRLTAGGTITGTLRDDHGAPLASGEVVLRTGDPVHSVDVRTDAAGRFTFTGVPPGIVDVAARAAGRAPHVVTVAAGATNLELPLVLAPHTPRRGSVRRRDGGPTAGITLRAEWPPSALLAASQVTTTGDDGTFAFVQAPAGTPRFSLRLPGEPLWRPIDAHSRWRDGSVDVDLPVDFAATAGLTGVMRDEHGKPLAEARLFVRSAEQPWIEAGRTAADGSYSLAPMPPGSWTLFAETTTPTLPTLQLAGIALAAGEHRGVDLQAPPCGRVVIDFVRADGAPIGDLVATLADRQLQRRCAVGSTSHLEQVLTPGDYTLAVMGSRVRWLDDVPVTITAGSTTTLRLELVPAARFTLSLLGLPAPVDDAPLLLHLHDAQHRWSTSFTLTADAPRRLAAVLAPGNYELEHLDADGRRWTGTFACSDDPVAPRAIAVLLAPR